MPARFVKLLSIFVVLFIVVIVVVVVAVVFVVGWNQRRERRVDINVCLC